MYLGLCIVSFYLLLYLDETENETESLDEFIRARYVGIHCRSYSFHRLLTNHELIRVLTNSNMSLQIHTTS